MIARPATPGKWCDASQKPTSAHAQALVDAGYVGIVRYVPLPNNNTAHDIDADELAMLTELGLEVMLVQHVRAAPEGTTGWDPRAHSGAVDGATAAEWAQGIGYPDAHIWQDLEGVLVGTPGSACIVYSNSWAGRILQSGFRAGLYVGFDVPLSPQELYEHLSHNSYWKDAGPREVAERGFAVQQLSPKKTVAGLRIDEDVVVADLLGEIPYACMAG